MLNDRPVIIQANGLAITVRRLTTSDSLDELTELLHRGYQTLANKGFRYFATYQTPEQTAERVSKGTCLIGVCEGKIVATVCYYSPMQTGGCPWYDRSDVASFGQFAVEPELQRYGVGSRLVELIEQMAKDDGAAEMSLDTAEGAAHLIRFYEKRGYRFIEHAKWKVTNYRSVIMTKPLLPRL